MADVAATALIAEDEPLLAQALAASLAQAWPGLRIVATVGDGRSAVTQALARTPDVLFFDIRMPGLSGLEAAAELADAWPAAGTNGVPFPALVFVTAYERYAVEAFEAQAVDYVIKPVQAARLDKTVLRLQQFLARRGNGNTDTDTAMETTLEQLRSLLGAGQGATAPYQPPGDSGPAPLKLIQASVGSSIRMVPIDDVLYFEAADKYVRVLTASQEYLIRTPLKELLPQLDPQVFYQVHRGTLVRAEHIESVLRDDAGKLSLVLRGRPEKLPVSRLYASLFKAM